MMKKIGLIILSVWMFCGCNYQNQRAYEKEHLVGKYKTIYVVHYPNQHTVTEVMYSDKEVYSCSFQGTNFLLEKDNAEEILSTTAPIQVVSSAIIK